LLTLLLQDHALLLLVGNAQRLTGQPYDAIATYSR
jgi:hypothetical protein